MKHRIATFCFVLATILFGASIAGAYWQSRQQVSIVTGSGCTESAAYITAANASGGGTVNGTYTSAFQTAICLMYSTSSTLGGSLASHVDGLYILGNQAAQFAWINVVNIGTYDATVVGSLTFTANQGYTGNTVGTNYLNSNFNPNTASSPKYASASAHIGYYVRAQGTNTSPVGQNVLATFYTTAIYPKFPSGAGEAYFRINDNYASPSGGVTVTTGVGYYLGVRSGATAQAGYKDGSDLGVTPVGNAGVPICPLIAFAISNDDGVCVGVVVGSDNPQLSLWHYGSSLSATDAAAMYSIWVTGFGATVGW